MTTKYSTPSTNPANLDSLVGVMRTAFTKLLQGVSGMLPAKIVSYDREKNRAVVQPLITMLDSNYNQIDRAQISNVPVLFMGGGGYILSFNLKPGDLGWIQANDRDISLFLQTYKKSRPNTLRIKDPSDSVFIPHPMTGVTIDSEDAENTVLQSLDGNVKISLGTDTITIKSPNLVIDSTSGDITVKGTNVTVEASGTAKVTSPNIELDGPVKVTGTNLTTLGDAGLAIARVGDAVQVNPSTGTGTIIAGGLNKSI